MSLIFMYGQYYLNYNYRLYRFKKYKNSYVLYVYHGYDEIYPLICNKGETITLITGKEKLERKLDKAYYCYQFLKGKKGNRLNKRIVHEVKKLTGFNIG